MFLLQYFSGFKSHGDGIDTVSFAALQVTEIDG